MSSAAQGAGPFPRRIFIPDQRIERLSRETLESAGLLPESPQPIRIDRFIYLQFGFEEEYAELPAHIMGCAKFTKRGLCRIMVNRDLAEEAGAVSHRRVRSTCELLPQYGEEGLDGEPVPKSIRYSWPDPICDEVLTRLLKLNAQRHAEELAAGQNTSITPKRSSKSTASTARSARQTFFQRAKAEDELL